MLVKWRLLLPGVLLGTEDATAARPEIHTGNGFTTPFSARPVELGRTLLAR